MSVCSGNRKDRSDRNREDRLSGRGPFGTERGGRHRFTYCATHQDVARHDASLGRQAVGRSRIQQPATGIAAGNSRSEYPEGGLRKRNLHAGSRRPPRAVPDGRRAHDGRHGRESRLRAFQPARHRPYRDCKRSQQYAVRLACRRGGNQPYHEENDQTAFHRRRCALRTDERAQLQEPATEGFCICSRRMPTAPTCKAGYLPDSRRESDLADRRMVQFLGCVLHVSGGE